MSVKSRLLVRTGGKKTLSTQEDSGQEKESGGTHPQRLCLIILAGIGALGPFLPWLTMSYGMMGESGSGIGRGLGAAWVILILFGIAIWACLLGDKTKPVLEVPRGVAVLSGLVSATIAIEKLITFHSRGGGYGVVSLGIGIYLIIFVGLVIPLAAFGPASRLSKETSTSD